MKYLILLVITMAMVAHAKEPRPCLQLKSIKVDKLHRWGSTVAMLTFKSRCPVEIESQGYKPPSPIAQLQNIDGLRTSVEEIRQVKSEGKILIEFTLEASDLPLGDHKLQGLVHYKHQMARQYVDEVLPFELPIKVLRAAPMDTFDYDHPIWTMVLIPFFIIAAIPVCLFLSLTGKGDCGSC